VTSGHDDHSHGGHKHLSHVPDSALPAVFAARAEVALDPPAHPDELESLIAGFFRALLPALAVAGCTLVGHIKGTLAAPGHGDLAFHATDLEALPSLTGGVAGRAHDAVLTINVIVFGVDEQALPALVRDAGSRATGAETVWQGGACG
jgi:hypothetical protein